jgi:epoxide hydrolase-like predicted phosphatase
MESKIKAIIFDFGGVLVRTSEPHGRQEWEAKLHLPAGKLEQVVHHSESWIAAQQGKITPEKYWTNVAKTLNIPNEDIPLLQRDYFRDDFLDLELLDLIRSLKKQKYVIGLLSNDSVHLKQKLKSHLGIYHLFDAVVISADIGVMKPDPQAYLAVAQRLGVKPEESIFIDDNPDNIKGAQTVGMKTIHYKTRIDLNKELSIILKST